VSIQPTWNGLPGREPCSVRHHLVERLDEVLDVLLGTADASTSSTNSGWPWLWQRVVENTMSSPLPLSSIPCRVVECDMLPAISQLLPLTPSPASPPDQLSNCSSTCPGSGPPVTKTPSSMLMVKAYSVKLALDRKSQ